MAVVSSSSIDHRRACPGPEKQAMEADQEASDGLFDMVSLMSHLPQKRKGLSAYFSGKSRSFKCMADAKYVDDLRKADAPEAKRRKCTDRASDQVGTSVFSHSGGSSSTASSPCCSSTGTVQKTTQLAS